MSKQVEMLADSIMDDFFNVIGDEKLKLKITDRLEQFERETIDAVKFECVEAVNRVKV